VVLGTFETDAAEAVRTVLAVDAQREVARTLTAPAVLEIAPFRARDAPLGLGDGHAVHAILAVSTVFAAVASDAKAAVVTSVAGLAAEVPLAGIVFALILLLDEQVFEAREELVEVRR
jgi:hypothetical protein